MDTPHLNDMECARCGRVATMKNKGIFYCYECLCVKQIHVKYTLCKHCDHFVDLEDGSLYGQEKDFWVHLDNGYKEHDHDAEPSSQSMVLSEWEEARPDLFVEHPDGNIGPNSKHHKPTSVVLQPYKHDCDHCIWVGWVPCRDQNENGWANMYLCDKRGLGKGSILIRYGDEPSEYLSYLVGASQIGSLEIRSD